MTIDSNKRPPTAKELWETATPLRQAYLTFGDPNKAAAYSAGPPKGALSGMFGLMLATIANTQDQLHPDAKLAPEKMAQHSRLGTELQDSFIVRLAAGEFTAFGYEHPRRLDDQPRQIPLNILRAGYRPESDSVKADGLHFEVVRVVLSSKLVTLPVAPIRGRPSSEATILMAYNALKATKGGINFDAPQKRLIEAIQDWLKFNKPNEYGDGNGFKKEAIRNAIAPLFKADKAANGATRDRKL